MKLELEHLAPYIPYKLKMIYDIEMGSIWELDTTNINAITEFDKPILRPLSDLTEKHIKEIYSRCPNIPNWSEFYKEWVNEKCDLSETIIEYAVVDILLEWHFDVFGLIEMELAIDINTLSE